LKIYFTLMNDMARYYLYNSYGKMKKDLFFQLSSLMSVKFQKIDLFGLEYLLNQGIFSLVRE